MTTKRVGLLQLLLLGGLSVVFVLPRHATLLPPAIPLELPQFVGGWYGVDQAITSGEREIPGPDTQFSRKLYTSPPGHQIYASISCPVQI